MKLKNPHYSFYTYLETSLRDSWTECTKKLIKNMKSKGFKYNPNEFGDYRNYHQDHYSNNRVGAPFYFTKSQKVAKKNRKKI